MSNSGMAGADGFVVFQRGKESDESDIWDDTALIKAYDNAVSIMKTRLAEREGQMSNDTANRSTTQTDGKGSKKKKKKRHRSKKKQQWKVGDQCRAVFTEDGLLYNAEIIGMDTAAGTCTVRYLEYENEEDHALAYLLPPLATAKTHGSTAVSESDSNEVIMQSPNPPRSGRGRSSGAAADQTSSSWGPFDSYPFFHGMPYPGPQSRFGVGHGAHTGPRVPMMPPPPPPPPPPMASGEVINEDEALSSMLISWYMSGYHTGYYQGLQQGRQQAGGGAAR